MRGVRFGGLRLGGVPLTRGSKHHHHLLARHASGSGKRGPEKPGGEGGAGRATGPGGLALSHARAPEGASAARGRDPRPPASPLGLTPAPRPASRTPGPDLRYQLAPSLRGKHGGLPRPSTFAAEPTPERGDAIPRRRPSPARSFIPARAGPPASRPRCTKGPEAARLRPLAVPVLPPRGADSPPPPTVGDGSSRAAREAAVLGARPRRGHRSCREV